MMYKEGFALSVKQGGDFLREKNTRGERQVYLPFDSEYSLYLKNKNNCRAVFQVRIDGKLTSPSGEWFVIHPNDSFELERFMLDGDMNKGERFKFVNVNNSGEEPGAADNGLVEVTIKKEKQPIKPRIIYKTTTRTIPNSGSYTFTASSDTVRACNFTASNTMNATYMCDLSHSEPEGVTVGGSESNQEFVNVPDFQTENTEIVLKLRLKPVKTSVVRDGTCPGCLGTGTQTRNDGIVITCPICDGSGEWRQ